MAAGGFIRLANLLDGFAGRLNQRGAAVNVLSM